MIDIAILIALTSAVVEAIKRAFKKLPHRALPLTSIIVGVILAIAYALVDKDVEVLRSALTGLVVGLSASGLYDTTKSALKNGGEKE